MWALGMPLGTVMLRQDDGERLCLSVSVSLSLSLCVPASVSVSLSVSICLSLLKSTTWSNTGLIRGCTLVHRPQRRRVLGTAQLGGTEGRNIRLSLSAQSSI